MGPPPGGCVLRSPMCILYSKNNGFCIISLKIIKNLLVFHTFLPWLASGAPLGGLGLPPGGLFWISLVASFVLEALWGPLWAHLCPFWSAFSAFRHPMGSYFLKFKNHFDFTYRCIFKFMFVFIIFLFYVAVCEETWSAKVPGGSILML